jgi:iron complex outermembrane receptor protein
MMRHRLRAVLRSTTAALAVIVPAAPALAQDAVTEGGRINTPPERQTANYTNSQEIVVTARKREETLLDVPVIAQVISGAQLERQQVVSLQDVAKLTPGLVIGTNVLSIGAQVAIRGVGTSSADPGIDQSVSLNIDGLSLGQGLAYSSGSFDLARIEVLKGPQALFFGKSSPGGVISLRTADPTNEFEVIARAGYEAEAHTRRGELIVSGPINDDFKVRLAGMYQKSDGYYYNSAIGVPAIGTLNPRHERSGNSESIIVRGTVLFNPSPEFDARLKLNYARDKTLNAENFQLVSCPEGTTGLFGLNFISPLDDCRKDRTGYVADYNPALYPGILNDGVAFVENKQAFGTLEMNFRFIPDITLTSVTGLYHLRSQSLLNTYQTGSAGPPLGVNNPDFRRDDFTEEFRLDTDFSSPLNFTLGAFFQSATVVDRVQFIAGTYPEIGIFPGFGPGAFNPLTDGTNRFKITTYSLFGQLRYQLTPNLELAAGARWTDERRRQNPILNPSAAYFPLLLSGEAVAARVPTPVIHSRNVAPEVTLTYQPDDDLTLFAAYKRGYKSGSFSIATPPTIQNSPFCITTDTCQYLDNSFGDEKVEGGEVGVKGRLLDRQLSFELAGFHYVYKGLQVGAIEPTAAGGTPVVRTVNAGSGKTTGVEFNANFRPRSVPGLSVNAALSYTHARFDTLNNAPCNPGQTFAQGCTEQFTPGDPATQPGGQVVNGIYGFYFAQDLSGLPFIRSPDWQGSIGFAYELPVGDAMKVTFSNSNNFKSDYRTAATRRSDAIQRGFVKVDASLALGHSDDSWEVALIGKNLTAQHTTSNCTISNFQGAFVGDITGGAVAGPLGGGEVGCYMDPGREIWLRLTLRPFG